ncbi:hypothetical protein FNF29_07274 [Cafeteria roenbergensis]|uniref:Methyltransferase type 12 domain-containing protein n=2 Tax=Cafeteria roenbergensis TaxID=33653 RepID=A0A5A8E8T7_CAFRO|nr:hypothetical protein FNF29_07274 [Cafeteria roenbergensis]KAA0172390.1 hypothetical protein FNF28_00073 [Cafeteria roenbergensis]|eukprot:KAA0147529.1 hypothetical protein FNF29_07274 [Cafeteria roenbergensis]
MAALRYGAPVSKLDAHRVFAAAAERNKGAILAALQRHLAKLDGGAVRLLEVGSGSGQHAAHCGAAMPDVEWTPSDFDGGNFASIKAWSADTPTVQEPVLLDAGAASDAKPDAWGLPAASYDVVLATNVIHISPWRVTEGLMAGSAHVLRAGGLLALYGPFLIDGRPTTESNGAFDESLRSRNPEWGIRDAAAVRREAAARGLSLVAADEMPSNNFFLVFQRCRDAAGAAPDDSAPVGRVPGLADPPAARE